jgi:hypothetical protein
MHLEKIFHKKMDIILTNSLLAKKQLIEQEDVKENKIIIIKNFFDPPKKKINLKKKTWFKKFRKDFCISCKFDSL